MECALILLVLKTVNFVKIQLTVKFVHLGTISALLSLGLAPVLYAHGTVMNAVHLTLVKFVILNFSLIKMEYVNLVLEIVLFA
jgi:hypothetical protein